MSGYYKKDSLSSQDINSNSPYHENITIVLHNGEMNSNGFISLTMRKYITQYTSGVITYYLSIEDLLHDIRANRYAFDIDKLSSIYKDLANYRQKNNVPIGGNRHKIDIDRTYKRGV